METPTDNLYELEDFDDNLSLRDLPIHDLDEREGDNGYRKSVSDQDFSFEFSTTTAQFDDFVMFPARIGKQFHGSFNDRETNSPFTLNSSPSFGWNNQSTADSNSSLAPSKSISRASSAMGIDRHAYSGMIKHGFLMGRVPVRMELSEIKKRQRKQSPPPMFPAAGVGVDGGRGQSGLVGPMRYRSLLLTVLAKASHGCIPRV